MRFSFALEIQRPAAVGEAHIVGDVIVDAFGAIGSFAGRRYHGCCQVFVRSCDAPQRLLWLGRTDPSGGPVRGYRPALGIDDQPGFLALAGRDFGLLAQLDGGDAVNEQYEHDCLHETSCMKFNRSTWQYSGRSGGEKGGNSA